VRLKKRHFKSIKTELIIIIMGSIGVAFIIAATIFFFLDSYRARKNMARELSVLASAIGDRSRAALVFNDKKYAAESLAALRFKPGITRACIIDSKGKKFVSYTRNGIVHPHVMNTLPLNDESIFNNNEFLLSRKILLEGEVIGLIMIVSDLQELKEQLIHFFFTIITVMLLSLSAALLFSIRMQKSISEPILSLARATRIIAQKKDYSTRVQEQVIGEIGILANGFNQMLEQIEIRETALLNAGSDAEQAAEKIKKINQELNLSHQELKISHEKILTILNCLDAIVYVTDMDTNEVLFANNYLQKIFGNIEGQICWQALQNEHEGPCSFCTNKLLLSPNGKPAPTYVWEHYNKKANQWFECRDTAISWYDGRLVRLEIANDITVRKEIEEKTRQMNIELEHRVEERTRELKDKQVQLVHAGRLAALGEMAAGIAHELGQPLQIIKSVGCIVVEELQKQFFNKEETIPIAQKISIQVDRAHTIINNMRTFARHDHNAKSNPVNIEVPTRDCLSFFKEQFHQNNIIFNEEIEENLPRVLTEFQKFQQIVANFLSNAHYAVEYQKKKQGKKFKKQISLRLFYPPQDNFIIMEIEDNGIGMSKEEKQRCLEPFFTTKETGKGTGLGLSISYGIMKEFNFQLEISSQLGKGSCFRLIMPIITEG
jgi:signal transduction histidine kinase/HAMP domain-containing protein